MLGYADVRISGRFVAWIGLIHPEDRLRVEREIEAHYVGASAMFESEHRMRHRDGTYRWTLSRGLAVRGWQGRATRMAGSLTDITHNKVIRSAYRPAQPRAVHGASGARLRRARRRIRIMAFRFSFSIWTGSK